MTEAAGAGGQRQGSSPAGQAGSIQPGSAGTTQAEPAQPGGFCSKLCVPQAQFVFYSQSSLNELQGGTFEACRNGDLECYQGKLPPTTGGNTVDFGTPGAWTGPTAFSQDVWTTIHFSWSGLESQPPLADGDRFTLELVTPSGDLTLLDRKVQFETVEDCAGPCKNAYLDLRGEAGGAPGVGGEAGAGAGAALP
jgi:hypothetical protein